MLRGNDVYLRLVQEKDLGLLFNLLQEFKNRGRYFPMFLLSEPQFKREFFETGFWNDDFRRVLVCDNNHNMIGSLFAWKVNSYSDTLEIAAILFEENERSKGYASEALKLFANHLFSSYPIHRIQGTLTTDNIASRRIMEKFGLVFEGISREAIFLNGKYVDLRVYTMLRSEWEAL